MGHGPYGGQGYQNMMGGHHGGGGYGMGGSGGGRGGVVPFRAGDWKCGNEGCYYHNFAKNVSCLRCGASRNQAAIVAESNAPHMQGYPGPPSNYGGQQMSMPAMDPNSYGGMGPGPGAYGGNAMSGPPGNYGGQSFGPPSAYLPSGLGAPSPYMQAGYAQMVNNGSQAQAGGFDSRAEQAFNQGNVSASGGAPGYSNGGYGQSGGGYGNDAAGDPFSFLGSSMANLGLSDDRRNGQGQGGAKSPQ